MAGNNGMRFKLKKTLAAALNKSLAPAVYSYRALKRAANHAKKSAPLVYQEIDHFIKSNVVHVAKHSPSFKKKHLAHIGEAITSRLLGKFSHVDHKELKKIVESKSSKSFIDIIAKGLSVGEEKEYTLLSKEKQFKKVLIANRGEIALRVIRACRELGIKTALVYSNHDKDNLAVKLADKSYYIGPRSSYLDIKKIIQIAKKVEADAIHPGYGFLAENAKFAKLCAKNNIKFIGPSSRTIGLLGNKVK